MVKARRKDPSAILWDLIVEKSKELIPGMNGFIGRAPDCLFNIWENFDPERHNEEDYRTKLGNAVSRYHDFLRVEQNGSIRITHRTNRPAYIIRQDRRDEFPFPNSTTLSDYYGFTRGLQKLITSVQSNDELYIFPGDLLVLSDGYGFEIRAFQKQPQLKSPRLADTQVIVLG